ISPPRGKTALKHSLCIDDVLIFCRASPKNLSAIHLAFELYATLSSRRVNWKKSLIYFGKGISSSRTIALTTVCGLKCGGESLNYLGVPLYIVALRQRWLISWINRIITRMHSWMGMTLSIECRIFLVSFVIYGMLLHSFQIYKWPSLYSFEDAYSCY
ncbi:hypothetical protein TorRG33x02_251230, partial [Trema orientale]